VQKQRLQTRTRMAFILLGSTFEIALKEYIVHRTDRFNESQYDENQLRELFRNRNNVIDELTLNRIYIVQPAKNSGQSVSSGTAV